MFTPQGLLITSWVAPLTHHKTISAVRAMPERCTRNFSGSSCYLRTYLSSLIALAQRAAIAFHSYVLVKTYDRGLEGIRCLGGSGCGDRDRVQSSKMLLYGFICASLSF
jgi:hypothetical protein